MAEMKTERVLNRLGTNWYDRQVIDKFKEMVSATEVIKFYIKTIQFFDEGGNKITEQPILVEQVFGDFDDSRLYDVSILKHK